MDARALRGWFEPERPGPMMFAHATATGIGSCRVDRWPRPRVVLVELPGDNYALRGDPAALDPADLADVAGLVEAPPGWLPALRRVDPGTEAWPRIVSTLSPTGPPHGAPTAGGNVTGPGTDTRPDPPPAVRRLGPEDVAGVEALDPELGWIHETWGGVQRLAESGMAWAAFAGGRPVSVAVTFYLGATYEDIGVVTDRQHRHRGLSTACASALVGDIRARGRRPSWTTSPGNAGSLSVAARLGFVRQRDDVLYAVRVPVPD